MVADAAQTARRPVLIMAFGGWNDVGDAAADLIGHIEDAYPTEVVGEIQPGPYYDMREHRPLVAVEGDGRRIVSWPTTEVLRAVRAEGDLILVRGPEPAFQWQGFCDEVLALVVPLAPRLAVAAGAVSAEVPHTMPLQARAYTQDARLAETLGAATAAHEGFTGITGVMADACDAAGIPALRVWASVPSYATTPPCPPATLALLQEINRLTGVQIDEGDLADRAQLWLRTMDDLVASQGLEDTVAAWEANAGGAGRGDDLADEILRFLKRRST